METPAQDTRQRLIETAGRLFAQHGYDGVSTRMIADTAEVNLGGIHYHFGGKLNLYVEAFQFAIGVEKYPVIKDFIHEYPNWQSCPEEQAKILQHKMFLVFDRIFDDAMPWRPGLIVQEVSHSSPVRKILKEKVFRPTTYDLIDFCKMIKPELQESETFLIGNLAGSQIVFYLLLRQQSGEFFEDVIINRDFFRQAAQFTATILIQYLGLPLPSTYP